MKNTKKPRLLTQGYSLLELVLVLAIVSVLVGLLLPKGFDALRNARIQQVEKTVDTLKTALTDYLSMAGGNGSLPRTEGTGIPTSGAALTGATDAAKGNAARLDTVLLATGKIEKPLTLRMGTQSYTSTGTGNEVTWSQAALGFVMTPDAAPQRNWSTVTRAIGLVKSVAETESNQRATILPGVLRLVIGEDFEVAISTFTVVDVMSVIG